MPTKTKTFKIDTIEVPINENKHPYVPDDNTPFTDTQNMLPTLGYAINENFPVLLIGETGTGKTSAIRHLAQHTNNAFRRVNLNGSTTVEELVGKILINKDGTYWVDGVLTECMRNGYWLLLDEINAALPEVLFVLQSVLDDDRFLVLAEKEDKEVVKMHPDFRIFATMNPFEDYVGTKELNKAFLSRFPITIRVEYPNKDQEKQILRARFPDATKLSDEIINDMVDFVHNARDSKNKEDLDFVFSTRDLIQWAAVFMHTQNAKKAADMTFLPKCNKADAKALRATLGLTFLDDTTKIHDLRRGSNFKLKEHVTVTNIAKVIPVGSVLSIVEWQKLDNPTSENARKVADAVKVRILRMPNIKDLADISPVFEDPQNQARLVKPGEEWAVAAADLDGKFVPVK